MEDWRGGRLSAGRLEPSAIRLTRCLISKSCDWMEQIKPGLVRASSNVLRFGIRLALVMVTGALVCNG